MIDTLISPNPGAIAPESPASPSSGEVDVQAIAASHPPSETQRKKRGRPLGSKNMDANASQAPSPDQPQGVGNGLALSPEVREQVTSCVKSLIKIIDSRCTEMVRRTALRITADKGFADGMAEDTQMTEVERDTMGTLTCVVIEKYNLLGTYAPEALLGLAVIGYGYRIHSTLADLKQLARDNGLSSQAKTPSDNGQVRDGKV